MKNILVVGDSTSSSLGGLSENWLSKIKSDSTWSEKIRFIDTCAPGITAGSALAIIVRQLISLRFSVFMIILSVGNCDRINRPYVSNKSSIMKLFIIQIKWLLAISKRKKSDWIKLDLAKWNSKIPVQSKQKIKNFNKSLKLIKYIANFFKIKLIVIIPRSNLNFPPATAKNNSLYFNLIGHDIKDNNFSLEALPVLESTKGFNLRGDSPITQYNFENVLNLVDNYEKHQIICAANNLAVKVFREGQPHTAVQILKQLLFDAETPSEFIHYNLANIYKSEGDSAAALEHYMKSLDSDTFSYRVNLDYSKVVKNIFQDTEIVKIIDLYEPDFDNCFLDHCHLLPQGQNLIFNFVCNYISTYIKSGEIPTLLKLMPSNPEIFEGDFRSYNEVFGVQSKVKIDISVFRGRVHSLDLLVNFFEEDLLKCKYADIIESLVFYSFTKQEIKSSSDDFNHAMISERLRIKNLSDQLNLNIPEIAKPLPFPEFSNKWLNECFVNLDREIQDFIDKSINSSYRMRTIMNWYFRESLYYGFNSSHEMLYERNSIRRWKEALFIASYLNQYQIAQADKKIMKYFEFIGFLEKLLSDSYLNLDFNDTSQDNIDKLELGIQAECREKWGSFFGK